MSRDHEDGESYVRKISEETARYTRDLLRENQRLRALTARLEAERRTLEKQLIDLRPMADENRDLRQRLEIARRDAEDALDRLSTARRQTERQASERLEMERQLLEIESESRRYLEQYLDVEQQNLNLANLYVAGYRLHSTLDRAEVIEGIQEIIVNLVGSEEFVILEGEPGIDARIVVGMGVDAEAWEALPEWAQRRVESCCTTGAVWVRDAETDAGAAEPDLVGCVPLRLDGATCGAIALFGLLPQKNGIEPVDRELFSLLASHAATALYCTRLHAAQQTLAEVS